MTRKYKDKYTMTEVLRCVEEARLEGERDGKVRAIEDIDFFFNLGWGCGNAGIVAEITANEWNHNIKAFLRSANKRRR